MAHRKPLGTTTWTRCRWHDAPPPRLDDFLLTASETAYRIVGIDETRRPDVFKLILERVATEDAYVMASFEPEFEGPRVHMFAWDSRSPKK